MKLQSMELFPFSKNIEIDPFMIKKPKPRFLGFGHNSTSNNSVDQCCIFLKLFFWMDGFVDGPNAVLGGVNQPALNFAEEGVLIVFYSNKSFVFRERILKTIKQQNK